MPKGQLEDSGVQNKNGCIASISFTSLMADGNLVKWPGE